MDIHRIILYIHPEAKFTLNANDYDQLIWLSDNIEKPSFKEIKAAESDSVSFYNLNDIRNHVLSELSNDMENIIEYILSNAQDKKLAQSTLDKYNAKKDLLNGGI